MNEPIIAIAAYILGLLCLQLLAHPPWRRIWKSITYRGKRGDGPGSFWVD